MWIKGGGRAPPRGPDGLTAAEQPLRARELGSIVITPNSASGGYGVPPILRGRIGFSWHWDAVSESRVP
ncbi:hypothetical protein TR51_23365 [Kitasatospora griseola]|uniref:Uncharacterized protein n=1 Tax=Kitasatospora griseola TaxID=2064 RepID=A0A0D0PNQ8_KITGR|nr:hypothetical protein TR51_23365 [Kitasatospora griseola]PJN26764.1 hypothetical protein CG736_09055 [Kitasatospora sp. CB02891]GGQ52224.1 hypothetical protein GCM10010195_04420 [Kitasatospora griseola]